MNKIGNKIRTIRENHGFSQDYIALKLGITQPSYARLEKADERISVIRLIEIAKILSTSVAELIEEKNSKIINLQNSENANAYNVDSIHTIVNADKEHIQTLKNEIEFLRKIISK